MDREPKTWIPEFSRCDHAAAQSSYADPPQSARQAEGGYANGLSVFCVAFFLGKLVRTDCKPCLPCLREKLTRVRRSIYDRKRATARVFDL